MAGNDELASYVIEQVDGLQKDKQTAAAKGAYGAVYKVSVRGFPCVAKRIHKALLNQPGTKLSVKEKEKTPQERFRKECVILSKLRHPNVVHFVGVHLGKDENDVTLLMECLHSDLAHFLQVNKDVPLSIKLSSLLDVSYGLFYLHNCDPPIIHRDLTARNILVTFDGRAKIGDLGVAKPFDKKQVRSCTLAPGQSCYMPPEALKEDAKYTQKIDIFSFGHLALHTIIQEEPKIFDIEHGNDTVVPQLNLQTLRREESLKRVGENHCMYSKITRCLQDKPCDRPTAEQLCLEMKELCAKYPKTSADLCTLLLSQDIHHEAIQEKMLSDGQVITIQQDLQKARQVNKMLQQQLEDWKKKCQDQKSSIENLLEKLSISQTVAMSNKTDFEEERKDREKAHSMLADIEMKFEKEKNNWEAKESSLVSQLDAARQRIDALTAQLSQATKEGESMRKKLRKLSGDETNFSKSTRWKRRLTFKRSQRSVWHFKRKPKNDLPVCDLTPSLDVCDESASPIRIPSPCQSHPKVLLSVSAPTGTAYCSDPKKDETITLDNERTLSSAITSKGDPTQLNSEDF